MALAAYLYNINLIQKEFPNLKLSAGPFNVMKYLKFNVQQKH